MKVVKEIARQIEAACLRHRIRTDRRRRGLPTDLKAVVAEYRQYHPEYADRLELLLYPRPQHGGRERHAGSYTAEC